MHSSRNLFISHSVSSWSTTKISLIVIATWVARSPNVQLSTVYLKSDEKNRFCAFSRLAKNESSSLELNLVSLIYMDDVSIELKKVKSSDFRVVENPTGIRSLSLN